MIRYINHLAFCSARLLTPLIIFPPDTLAVEESYLPFTDIPLSTLAALEVSEETQDGQPLFTSKLTAVLRCPFTVPTEPIALRLETTDGTYLLIGTAHRPYPITTVAITHPEKTTERSAHTLTTTWTAPTPALRLVQA